MVAARPGTRFFSNAGHTHLQVPFSFSSGLSLPKGKRIRYTRLLPFCFSRSTANRERKKNLNPVFSFLIFYTPAELCDTDAKIQWDLSFLQQKCACQFLENGIGKKHVLNLCIFHNVMTSGM